ncbi:MAG: hypothetical protein VKL01_10335 [Limnothrix sp.]|uniref:hypothetical protein n=1 Tax=Limnothrix sp. FACHB-881 TaxID=2692819 RepID=UPI0016834F27|nr:hypothetical protein [Limnothrix sp. FACHB-881]MBD2636844.1 hypothetical protein [Limnothrix sp. FACHB-881]MEB3118753.1 hypothetical protein [Limnothrix sp.]
MILGHHWESFLIQFFIQHGLGLILATYLAGFSIAYWRSLSHRLQILKQQQAAPDHWRSGTALVLQTIWPQLLWFWPKPNASPNAIKSSNIIKSSNTIKQINN